MVAVAAGGPAASDLLQTLHLFQKFGKVGPWHTTVTAAHRAGDQMTGDQMTGDRGPIAIDPTTDLPIGPIGAALPTSPDRVRRAR